MNDRQEQQRYWESRDRKEAKKVLPTLPLHWDRPQFFFQLPGDYAAYERFRTHPS